RMPVARRLLDTTDRAFRLAVADNWIAGLFRTQIVARVAAFALARPNVQNFAFRTVSQTGIHYRESRLSRSLDDLPQSAPRGGDRFPWLALRFTPDGPVEDSFRRLADLGFTLILFGQEAPADGVPGFGDLLHIHAVPADRDNTADLGRAGIPVPSFYLLRPDGHVGLCGGRFDAAALARYATATLRLASG